MNATQKKFALIASVVVAIVLIIVGSWMCSNSGNSETAIDTKSSNASGNKVVPGDTNNPVANGVNGNKTNSNATNKSTDSNSKNSAAEPSKKKSDSSAAPPANNNNPPSANNKNPSPANNSNPPSASNSNPSPTSSSSNPPNASNSASSSSSEPPAPSQKSNDDLATSNKKTVTDEESSSSDDECSTNSESENETSLKSSEGFEESENETSLKSSEGFEESGPAPDSVQVNVNPENVSINNSSSESSDDESEEGNSILSLDNTCFNQEKQIQDDTEDEENNTEEIIEIFSPSLTKENSNNDSGLNQTGMQIVPLEGAEFESNIKLYELISHFMVRPNSNGNGNLAMNDVLFIDPKALFPHFNNYPEIINKFLTEFKRYYYPENSENSSISFYGNGKVDEIGSTVDNLASDPLLIENGLTNTENESTAGITEIHDNHNGTTLVETNKKIEIIIPDKLFKLIATAFRNSTDPDGSDNSSNNTQNFKFIDGCFNSKFAATIRSNQDGTITLTMDNDSFINLINFLSNLTISSEIITKFLAEFKKYFHYYLENSETFAISFYGNGRVDEISSKVGNLASDPLLIENLLTNTKIEPIADITEIHDNNRTTLVETNKKIEITIPDEIFKLIATAFRNSTDPDGSDNSSNNTQNFEFIDGCFNSKFAATIRSNQNENITLTINNESLIYLENFFLHLKNSLESFTPKTLMQTLILPQLLIFIEQAGMMEIFLILIRDLILFLLKMN